MTAPGGSGPADIAITGVEVFLVRLPVKLPRKHGSGEVAGRVANVVLKLTTDSGIAGWGEAAPWTVFTGSAEANAAALDVYFRPFLLGANPCRVTALMREAEKTLVGHGDAKAALETALLDILGQVSGLPISDLLGGRCRDEIPLSFSIANPDFEADFELASKLYDEGLRLFKVKTGFAEHACDITRLERLRETLPDDAELRVDYNQGLAPFEAITRLRDIEAFRPTFIEQPVPGDQVEAMAAITAALDTPVMADESVFTPAQALRAVEKRIADILSIKIMKSGGMLRAREVAAIAEAGGLACYGGDMFETGIAHLAGAQMIAATPNISLGCEFYQATYYLEQDLLAEAFPVKSGKVIVPRTPGLGIRVDEDRVRHCAEISRG